MDRGLLYTLFSVVAFCFVLFLLGKRMQRAERKRRAMIRVVLFAGNPQESNAFVQNYANVPREQILVVSGPNSLQGMSFEKTPTIVRFGTWFRHPEKAMIEDMLNDIAAGKKTK